MKRQQLFWIAAALAFFCLLTVKADSARAGAAWGVELCCRLLIPALLPFFAAAGLLNRLGFAALLGERLGGLTGRLFGVSGEGAAAFLLGLTGGYPLGAATVAGLFRDGRVDREEAERLLTFCDNTGPAFAVGAVGAGVFGSPAAGLFLYAVHVLSAVLTGVLLSFPRRRAVPSVPRPAAPAAPFAEAFTGAVRASGAAAASLCAFVVLFSSLLYVLDGLGVFGSLAGVLSVRTGAELRWCRALLCSALELSGAVGLMQGLAPAPANLALAAFALSWGGLCVHCQSMGVCAGTGLRTAGRLRGKLLHGLLAAGLSYIMSTLWL